MTFFSFLRQNTASEEMHCVSFSPMGPRRKEKRGRSAVDPSHRRRAHQILKWAIELLRLTHTIRRWRQHIWCSHDLRQPEVVPGCRSQYYRHEQFLDRVGIQYSLTSDISYIYLYNNSYNSFPSILLSKPTLQIQAYHRIHFCCCNLTAL